MMKMSDRERNVAKTAADYCNTLKDMLENAVLSLRADNTIEGLNHFLNASGYIQYLIRSVIDLNDNCADDVGIDTGAIAGHFSEMMEAAENSDFVLLTDLLEYELLPVINEWREKLEELLRG